jgi:hypothetical protein
MKGSIMVKQNSVIQSRPVEEPERKYEIVKRELEESVESLKSSIDRLQSSMGPVLVPACEKIEDPDVTKADTGISDWLSFVKYLGYKIDECTKSIISLSQRCDL